MPLKSSRLRLITRILLALLLALSAMSAGVFWLLQRNPQALAEHYIAQIAASTGLTITVESVNVALLPLPSLAVSNASVTGKGLSFTVAYATLRPDFLALLRGELLPRNITLLRPQFQGQVPSALAAPRVIPADPATEPAADAAAGPTVKAAPAAPSQPLPNKTQTKPATARTTATMESTMVTTLAKNSFITE